MDLSSPPGAAYLAATSDAWAPGDQFDALRSMLFAPHGLIRLVKADHCGGRMPWASAVVLGPAPGGGFGRFGNLGKVSAGGSFGSLRSAAIQAQRPQRSDPAVEEAFIFTWLRSGTVVYETPAGMQSEVQAGTLSVYDTTRPMRFHRSATHGLNLLLPRPAVLAALQGRVPASGVLRKPSRPGVASLAPFLCAQLDLLDRLGPSLGPESLASALGAASQLAIACLREGCDMDAYPLEQEQEATHTYTGLLAAARQHMRQHLHQHDLGAGQIAAVVHSSRARLYRAFASQGSSVFAELRALRLDAARQRLERTAEPIATLAWHCGFASASAFSRLFRARFGASPQEWRAQHL